MDEKETGDDRAGWRLLGDMRPHLAVVVLFSSVINLAVSASPLFMMQVMERVLPSGNLATLGLLTLIAGAALLANALLDYLRGVLLSRVADGWEARWSPRLLRAAFALDRARGATAADLERVKGFFAGPAPAAFLDAPWVLVFFAVVYLLHPLLAALGLAFGSLLLAIAFAGAPGSRRRAEAATAAVAEAGGVAAQLDRNRPLLATMGMAGHLIGLQERLSARARDLRGSAAEADARRHALARWIRAMLQILTLALGARLVLAGELSGGGMIAASILIARAVGPIEQIAGLWFGVAEARAALSRLGGLADAADAPETRTRLPDPEGRVAVEAVTMPSAPGKPPRLHQIDLQIAPGECVAIIGPSGSGKTTLAGLIAGAHDPVIGTVRLDGADLRHWPADQRARAIGYLPQAPTLFPGTIAENIARFDPGTDDWAIVEAAQAAGVHALISRLPEGYDTRIDFETGPVSGGERQRIALARALCHRPRVLVLDEPNASLDREGERALIAALERLKASGTAIVLVAHRASVLAIVDTVLALEQGRIRDTGPRHDVLARMNSRTNRLALPRRATELATLEDWVVGQVRAHAGDALRAKLVTVATELFGLCLNGTAMGAEAHDAVFTLSQKPGWWAITMADRCAPVPLDRLDAVRRLAATEDAALALAELEAPDLALLLLFQVASQIDQRTVDGGRVLVAGVRAAEADRADAGRPGRISA
ncbi:MAG: type I secretion system permease/ATPase [Paracoccaceae bacterium]